MVKNARQVVKERTAPRIAVRALAAYACRRGDIHARFDDTADAQEGIATQRRLQRNRGERYQREVTVSTVWLHRGRTHLALAGRIDGVDRSASEPTVEEYKTTREDPARVHAHLGALHFAQLTLYAAMLAREEPSVATWRLRLVYCNPDTDASTAYEDQRSPVELERFLDEACSTFALALAKLARHRGARDRKLARLAFPHAEMRAGQRRLAHAVFRAIRDGGTVLAEAPTGSGKTLGTLFPALRAIGDGHCDRAVVLSARGTGQAAAAAALEQLGGRALTLRSVDVTAKQKICFKPEPICDPEICEFARGYYDRLPGALAALLARRRIDRTAVEAVARAHCVCPFELTLDAAVWSDVIVCDYNYVFDPVVKLNRLRGVLGDRVALLIDEAHQLADRVRDSLSTRLDRAAIRAALRAPIDERLGRALGALDRSLMALRREHVSAEERKAPFERPVTEVARLDAAVARAIDVLAARDGGGRALGSRDPAVTTLGYALMRWQRVSAWYDAKRFATLLTGRGREVSVELRCLDPSVHIGAVLGEFESSVRFSGTLTPLQFVDRLHGVAEGERLRVPSAFPSERLGVFVVPDIATRYRARAASLDRLVDALGRLVQARAGNYLVALPSFAYLDSVATRFVAAFPQHPVVRQRAAMSDAERREFVAAFAAEARPIVAFAVLGGLFTESIDLPGERLIGMAVVGIGLPPPTVEREALAACLGEEGRLGAYLYPAMTKVVQAAGRLIRSEHDRAAVCLIDDRYLAPEYQDLMPPHWSIRVTPQAELAAALDGFWNSG